MTFRILLYKNKPKVVYNIYILARSRVQRERIDTQLHVKDYFYIISCTHIYIILPLFTYKLKLVHIKYLCLFTQ